MLKFVRSPDLEEIEAGLASHPLVLSASAMVRLLTAIKCLVNAKVYVRATNIHSGQMTLFYMLTACMQSLPSESEVFSSELCGAVRRKASLDGSPDLMCNSHPQKPLSPLWVAAGLYYRVAEGLLGLAESPFLAKVLGDMSTYRDHWSDVHSNVLGVLEGLPLIQKANGKIAVSKGLSQYIPIVQAPQSLDIALWDCGVQVLSPMTLRQVADPFSEVGWNMGTFFDDNSSPATCLPYPKQVDGVVEAQEPSSPDVPTDLQPHDQGDIVADLFDPHSIEALDGNTTVCSFWDAECS